MNDTKQSSLSAGEPDGMETSAGEREAVMKDAAGFGFFTIGREWIKRLLRDIDRLLAREVKAREEERKDAADFLYMRGYRHPADLLRSRSKP